MNVSEQKGGHDIYRYNMQLIIYECDTGLHTCFFTAGIVSITSQVLRDIKTALLSSNLLVISW